MIDQKECHALNKKCGVKMHTTVTVGTKGQVVIPQEVREMLNIKPGDTLMVVTKHGKAVGMVKLDNVDELMEYIKKEQMN
ncbi:AbrB/MazE/SpoVT family DNA-binding domain-containing protein [Candidatus Gracilibacteria bacterium]|nr:AbrB/MazE/SpoVT family DNA-binding domain-containing protein [Candidatus Gracilibacteria bacterium]